MNTALRFLTLAILFFNAAHAAEPDGKLVYRAYGLPPEYLREEGQRSFDEKTLIPNTDTYDVKSFLESRGIVFPEGAEATYSTATRGLLIKSTRENIEQTDGLLQRLSCGWPKIQLRAHFTVYSFRGPVDPGNGVQYSYQKLRELAGDSWTEVARLSGLINQSMRSDLIRLTTNPSRVASSKKPGEAALPDGTLGQHLAIEANLSDDGELVSASLFLQFRDEVDDGNVVDFSYTGFLSSALDTPMVVEITSAKNSKDKYAAVLSFSTVNPLTGEALDLGKIGKPIVQPPPSGNPEIEVERPIPSAPAPQQQ